MGGCSPAPVSLNCTCDTVPWVSSGGWPPIREDMEGKKQSPPRHCWACLVRDSGGSSRTRHGEVASLRGVFHKGRPAGVIGMGRKKQVRWEDSKAFIPGAGGLG